MLFFPQESSSIHKILKNTNFKSLEEIEKYTLQKSSEYRILQAEDYTIIEVNGKKTKLSNNIFRLAKCATRYDIEAIRYVHKQTYTEKNRKNKTFLFSLSDKDKNELLLGNIKNGSNSIGVFLYYNKKFDFLYEDLFESVGYILINDKKDFDDSMLSLLSVIEENK